MDYCEWTYPQMNPPVRWKDLTRLPWYSQARHTKDLETVTIAVPTGRVHPAHLGGPLAGQPEHRHYVAFLQLDPRDGGDQLFPAGALQRYPEDRPAVMRAIAEARADMIPWSRPE